MNNIAYVCWKIWKMKGVMVMERKSISIHEAIMQINMVVGEFYRLKKDLNLDKRGNGNDNAIELEWWIKPEEGWFKVNCDEAFD